MADYFLTGSSRQMLLLPVDPTQWLPKKHVARFLLDAMFFMDLAAIYAWYTHRDRRGAPAYDPRSLATLIVYGYCRGVRSSRQLER